MAVGGRHTSTGSTARTLQLPSWKAEVEFIFCWEQTCPAERTQHRAQSLTAAHECRNFGSILRWSSCYDGGTSCHKFTLNFKAGHATDHPHAACWGRLWDALEHQHMRTPTRLFGEV